MITFHLDIWYAIEIALYLFFGFVSSFALYDWWSKITGKSFGSFLRSPQGGILLYFHTTVILAFIAGFHSGSFYHGVGVCK